MNETAGTPPPLLSHEQVAELLSATGVGAHARRARDPVPDALVFDVDGKPVHLSQLWSKQPLVLIFYRGGWCQYCSLQLRAWRGHAGALSRLGANLVAISPQTPENSRDTFDENELIFPVFSDSSMDAANAFGIAFMLPPDLVDFYGASGTDIPVLNGNGQWVLPVPATYVIGRDGVVRFAHVDGDSPRGADPVNVLAVLEKVVEAEADAIR